MTTSSLTITGGGVLTPDGWVDQDVHISNGYIAGSSPKAGSGTALDARGFHVVPGLIDLQVNGGWGLDFASRPESIWEVGEHLGQTGVTAWLPTLVTSAPEQLGRARQALRTKPDGWVGAEPIGWHLEGPWLNPVRKGAHREKFLCVPALPLAEFISAAEGIALVTLAPEMPGCLEAVDALIARGVVVSLGHSNADLQTSQAGFEAGATMVTHLFNAMSGLHHREPGLAAAMLAGDVYGGLIVDGIHVAPEMVKLAWKTASEQIVLVSDSMAGLGMPEGTVKLGSYEVILDGTSARLSDGTLAGSVLDMPTAIRNLVAYTGCALHEAITAATLRPATVLGDPSRGRLRPGCRGDVVLLDDDLNVAATVVGGEVVFER